MRLRTWWVLLLPAVAAALYAATAEDPAEGLVLSAGALALSGVLHGLRRGPVPGTPAQNGARVVLVVVVAAVAWLLLIVAFLAALFSGFCDGDCETRPWRVGGLVVGGALAVGALLVLAAAAWIWLRIGRARGAGRRTPRPLLLVPAAAVGLVAVVAALVESDPPEPVRPPAGTGVVVAAAPCEETGVGAFCEAARLLRSADSGATTLAVWRTASELRGVMLPGRGSPRPVALARGLAAPAAVPAAVAVTAHPAGGFVAAWSDDPAAGVRLARVALDGTVHGAPAVRPGPNGGDDDGLDGERRPGSEIALAATGAGFVVFAFDPAGEGPDATTRLRVRALDRRLRARGAWRTVGRRVPSGLGPGVRTAGGGAALTLGTTVVRRTVEVDEDGRLVRSRTGTFAVRGPGGARVGPPPGPRGLRSARYDPALVDAVHDRSGTPRALWTTIAGPSAARPGRTEQQWVVGPGAGTPAAPVAEGLREPQLATPTGGPLVLGLRPRARGRDADVDVVVVDVR